MGLLIKVLSIEDSDLLELHIRASNGRFAGETTLYDSSIDLLELATKIKGFPRSPSEVIEYSMGNVQFRFYCTDAVGHTAVYVNISDDPKVSNQHCALQRAVIDMEYEPFAIEVFSEQLANLVRNKAGSAFLETD
jgi:hypothetical protein